MLSTKINALPSADNDFQPLSEYEAQTPATFFEGKPVLYYHDQNVKAWVSNEQAERLYFFSKLPEGNDLIGHPSPPESYALGNRWGNPIREEERVEAFVTTHKLILFSHNSGTGIEIPYPSITLHAVKNFHHLEKPNDEASKFIGVYMQIEFTDLGDDDDDFFYPIELTLIPYQGLPKEHPAPEGTLTIDPLNTERTMALFNQISACSNLNPDPEEDQEEDYDAETDRIIFEGEAVNGLPGVTFGDSNGGLPPPMPGSSGWITADNVHEYFDADGNWIGENGASEELGAGAGRVRGHDEVNNHGANGHADQAEDGDSKRPRTE
ncbi:regulator of volume decrease after cellular swelling-domain-containing protein [Xylariomycetidae sp. FL2044]|nr:regulator of volume decrease after cellular swelling-domain-containing protein [Xylariomycetidae sp. FL2044]